MHGTTKNPFSISLLLKSTKLRQKLGQPFLRSPAHPPPSACPPHLRSSSSRLTFSVPFLPQDWNAVPHEPIGSPPHQTLILNCQHAASRPPPNQPPRLLGQQAHHLCQPVHQPSIHTAPPPTVLFASPPPHLLSTPPATRLPSRHRHLAFDP
jgi:hypothetical protein